VDECEVTLCYGGNEQIVIEVSDAGAGFDVGVGVGGGGRLRPGRSSPGAAELNDDGGGFGLFNITQRITHIGGRVEVLAQPGSGTTVTLTVPKSRSSNTNSGERS
jgi:signal transduction histidine kinase